LVKGCFAINLIVVGKMVNLLIWDRWLASGVAVLAYSETKEFKEARHAKRRNCSWNVFFLRAFEPWVQQE